jgi:hypothetical protein
VKLAATGKFFDEDYDDVSREPITLNAIADISNGKDININLLTHFEYARVEKLVKEGKSINEACQQARTELLDDFGLGKYNTKDFSEYSLLNGDDDTGILTALSLLLLRDRHSSGQLSSYLSILTNDFADDGKFSKENRKQLAEDRDNLSLEYKANHLEDYYKNIGMTLSVPSLFKYYDWNDNGIAGDEIYDGTQTFTMDKTEINAPYTGGSYTITINSSIPFYTYLHGGSNDSYITTPDMDLLQSSIKYKYSLSDDNVLSIEVDTTSCSKLSSSSINLYDVAGNVLGTVMINQETNPNGSRLSGTGTAFINAIMYSTYEAVKKANYIDAAYTKQNSVSELSAPVSASNEDISYLWNYSYEAISRFNNIIESTGYINNEELKPADYIYNALLYINLINFFGDVPYDVSQNNYNVPRKATSDIFSDLRSNINGFFNTLPKDDLSSNVYDAFAFPTLYQAYTVMANINLEEGNFADAKKFYLEVINSGKYNYDSNYNKGSKEIIFGFDPNDDSSSAVAETYTDLMLKLAECEYKIGNSQKAIEYINNVATAKDVSFTSEDPLENIKLIRNSVLKGMGGYFAFLKRNNLAKTTLQLEDYELLLPIPWRELAVNPSITQNPGY